ncbi:MAG: decarboxylating 6-phosphogluconate dehydrogenase [Chloroflexota bacterium]|nr:MAG: decarboxylating 6-phosphogluconate dehydrogenase [Chloroflexota bacterium]
MKLAMIGLGRMGGNMSRRLLQGGHQVAGYNRHPENTLRLAEEDKLIPLYSLEEVVSELEPPRVVWIMVPAGDPTEQVIQDLAGLLGPGDTVIDGGNSNYQDSIRRAALLTEREIHFLDVGVSGGIWGLKEGYSMMIGGEREVCDRLRPVFETLAPAPDRGWGYVGPSGAGHYVKMVHNGIEYGLMEAYAEGFELLKARSDLQLDPHQVSEIWRHGSVVRSWLLDLAATALAADPDLSAIKDWVADSGEGRWTVTEAINSAVPVPAIAISLFRRFNSRQEESFAAKLVAAMRQQFGGHDVKSA